MIKILQILPGLSRGGLETFVMNVYRSIDKSNYQFDFLVNCKDGDYKEEIINMGGRIYYLPPKKFNPIKYNQNLNSFFKKHAFEYTAVHMHDSVLSAIEPLKYAKKYGIKVRVLHSHSSSVSGNKIHYILHALKKPVVHTWATHYLGCSDKANKWFYKYTGVLGQSIFVPNGIDVSKYVYNEKIRETIRKGLSIPENHVVIGHVGRIMWIKNHEFLIDIFNEYHKTNPNSTLVLIGTGPLLDRMQNKVKDLGLEEYVRFTGVRSDINELLQGLDIFVMPSIYEGLPVVLVEAQAAGLPALVSDTISKDSKITNSYYSLNLKDPIPIWCNRISEIVCTHKRENTKVILEQRGFDINTTSKLLTRIYTNSKL